MSCGYHNCHCEPNNSSDMDSESAHEPPPPALYRKRFSHDHHITILQQHSVSTFHSYILYKYVYNNICPYQPSFLPSIVVLSNISHRPQLLAPSVMKHLLLLLLFASLCASLARAGDDSHGRYDDDEILTCQKKSGCISAKGKAFICYGIQLSTKKIYLLAGRDKSIKSHNQRTPCPKFLAVLPNPFLAKPGESYVWPKWKLNKGCMIHCVRNPRSRVSFTSSTFGVCVPWSYAEFQNRLRMGQRPSGLVKCLPRRYGVNGS